jgi:hypothetical protein
MAEQVMFYEGVINGVVCRGFHSSENREQVASEVMTSVYNFTEQIRDQYDTDKYSKNRQAAKHSEREEEAVKLMASS